MDDFSEWIQNEINKCEEVLKRYPPDPKPERQQAGSFCPHCGVEDGMSWGTGDCDCDPDPY